MQDRESDKGILRQALVRVQAESPRTAVRYDPDQGEPEGLDQVGRTPAAKDQLAVDRALLWKREQDGIAESSVQLSLQRLVDDDRRESLAGFFFQPRGDRFEVPGEELLEARVDPVDLDPGSAGLSGKVRGCPLQENRRHGRLEEGREPGFLRQIRGQLLPEEALGDQGAINAAQPLQGQIPQAPAHGIPHQQGPGEHGCGHGRAEQHGQVDPPEMDQTSTHLQSLSSKRR